MDPITRARIEALLASHPIILFMKGSPQFPQCGFSAKACGMLNQLAADFHHVDILSDPELREGLKTYSNWPTYPQLYIQGELIGGSDIIAEMHASGELLAMTSGLSD